MGAAYFISNQLASEPVVKTSEEQRNADVAGAQTTQTISYQGEEGKTALDLLKENYVVETKAFDFGEMVTAINGVAADQSHFWAFYVNGEISQVGAGDFITTHQDLVEWKLEEIR